MRLSHGLKKALTLATTLIITGYLIYKVYTEASGVELTPRELLSPYFIAAIFTGLIGYLTYTLIWYLYLRNVTEVGYKRVLLTNLAGTYLSFSLNAAIGTLVKVKFIGATYWDVLATSVLGILTEFIAGLTLITALGGGYWGIILAGILALPMIFDEWVFRALLPLFQLFHVEEVLNGLYSGWKDSTNNHRTVIMALTMGFLLVTLNSTTLYLVAKTFGLNHSFLSTLKGSVYSNFLGGALGTPGGIGANELGVMMALGRNGMDVVVAFFYKLVNQYIYALIGALAFYKFVLHEIEGEGSYVPNSKREQGTHLPAGDSDA